MYFNMIKNNATSACKNKKDKVLSYVNKIRYSRSKKRILYSLGLMIIILTIFLFSRSRDLDGVLVLVLPAFLAYIFYLDQKRIEKLSEYKFQVYMETIKTVSYYYRVPALFLSDNISEIKEFRNLIPQDNITSSMILVSNSSSYIAMSKLSRTILSKTLNLLLILEKGLTIKNAKKKSIDEFYKKIDKSAISIKTLNEIDKNNDPFESLTNKFSILSEALITIREINQLIIELANEMRKDLELDEIPEDQRRFMVKSLDESVNKLFEFLQSLLKQFSEGMATQDQ